MNRLGKRRRNTEGDRLAHETKRKTLATAARWGEQPRDSKTLQAGRRVERERVGQRFIESVDDSLDFIRRKLLAEEGEQLRMSGQVARQALELPYCRPLNGGQGKRRFEGLGDDVPTSTARARAHDPFASQRRD